MSSKACIVPTKSANTPAQQTAQKHQPKILKFRD